MVQMKVLEKTWENNTGYVFLPRRKPSAGVPWQERSFRYPQEVADIKKYIEDSVDNGYDVYWCPIVFEQASRTKENACKLAKILWADLDEVDPKTLDLKPTIAWASSTNRYQALWLLTDEHSVIDIENTNRQLTYATGADKSGWDITQVLRIPATPNYKYDPCQDGKMLWADKKFMYKHSEVQEFLSLNSPTPEENFDDDELNGYDIPKHVIELLKQPTVEVGTRSDKLWEIECALLEAGVPMMTILNIVKNSQWNKYAGRRDEDTRIFTELLKADKHVKEKPTITPLLSEDNAHMWAVDFETFMTTKIEQPKWLVEGIWQEGSCGIVAGEPKTYKSILTTDLALSIASGIPFLGCIPVKSTGAVLFIQEENSAATVHDRVQKVAHHKGLGIRTPFGYQITPSLPIYFSNNVGTELTEEASRVLIEETIDKIKPKMVILDPLYMMLGGSNENDANDMRSVLKWLTSLRNRYDTAVLVIHHYKKGTKQTNNRGGQNVRGSSSFHAWVESAMYLRTTDNPYMVDVEREFRTFPTTEPMRVEFALGAPGALSYNTQVYFNPVTESVTSAPVKLTDKEFKALEDSNAVTPTDRKSKRAAALLYKNIQNGELKKYRGKTVKLDYLIQDMGWQEVPKQLIIEALSVKNEPWAFNVRHEEVTFI